MLFVRLFLSVQYNYQVQYHTGYLSVPQCQTTVAFKYSIKHVKYSWLLIACLAQLTQYCFLVQYQAGWANIRLFIAYHV